jgi:hypothetical protein
MVNMKICLYIFVDIKKNLMYIKSELLTKFKQLKKKNLSGEKMLTKFDLQHFCCGPKGCELEIVYGEMIDAEE